MNVILNLKISMTQPMLFDTSSFSVVDLKLSPGDTVSLNTSFYPVDTLNYQLNTQFKVELEIP